MSTCETREMVHAILVTKQMIANQIHHKQDPTANVRRLDRMIDRWVRATGARGATIKAMRKIPDHFGAPCTFCRAKRLRAQWAAQETDPMAARVINSNQGVVDAWLRRAVLPRT